MATITSLKGNHIWPRIAMHRRTSFVGKPAALVFGKRPIQAPVKLHLDVSTVVSLNVDHQDEVVRPKTNFAPCMWGDTFSYCTILLDNQVIEENIEEIKTLKEEVWHMIMSSEKDIIEKMSLIDTLERLGISYHFEEEIEDQLSNMFDLNVIHEEDDLYNVALYFRLFRQHGYPISSDHFNQFKDNNGKFKEALLTDAKGLLSLYEAAYVRKHGDDILDEALIFAKSHLERITPILESTLEKQVTHALMQPLHKGLPRIEAHFNISIYEECGSRNDKLLRFAKLDYNLLQLLHKKELSELTLWWKDLKLVSELPYIRDRIVECFLCAIGVYFEPQYSQARIMLTKCIVMLSVLDDTYDSYGTLDELLLFTKAVERWDLREIDRLPSYMKTIYSTLLNLFKDYDIEVKELNTFNGVCYVKEAMKEIVRSYYIEAKWFIKGNVPLFEEYLNNALITGAFYLLVPASLLGMRSTSKASFDWILNKPKILLASAIVGRVVDDIASYKVEKERGQLVTGIECYMKEHNLSIEEVNEKLFKLVENAWKALNKELIKPTSMSAEVQMRIVNFTRIPDVVYKNNQDGYSDPKYNLKPLVESLLVHPIHM
ncbi:vetispiradiene synthase 3 isoform X2 [Capsicum chacoense]